MYIAEFRYYDGIMDVRTYRVYMGDKLDEVVRRAKDDTRRLDVDDQTGRKYQYSVKFVGMRLVETLEDVKDAIEWNWNTLAEEWNVLT